MPLDASIPLAGLRPVKPLMTPAEGLQLQQFAGQVSDENQARQDKVRLSEIFRQPGAIDQQTGVATP